MSKKKEWPVSIIKDIEEINSYNAPVRTISILIPIDSVKFGKDCIELLNAIIKKLYKKDRMNLGDRIVGTKTSTHQILKDQGLAGELKTFGFLTKGGSKAQGNATANKLKDSVGEYIKKWYGGSGVSIFGVSAMDGYHSMLLTYQRKDGKSKFTLIDQGPATSFLTGKSTFYTANDLDSSLSEYVKDRQDKRVGKNGIYEYPADIALFKIYPETPK
ncbi:hypothetical protein MNBD_GAMMA09-1765 [hydrothermal vent metagenome]|uniref:Uncharacterized protein n=1 Tax=hydrothermal vent metagenome TaxID=652676 RepID=A0A3B0XVS1_9ZZZZ